MARKKEKIESREKTESKSVKPSYLAFHDRFDRTDLLILLIIFAISLFLRTYALSQPERIFFDETHYIPAARTFLSLERLDPNDIHPPLAKQIIAIFLKVFGDWAVGWRAGSVFFGMIMIVTTYLLALSIFKNRFAPAVASGMLGAEFLHITQSRIATLDIYIAGFILLGYYFTWLYIDSKPTIGLGKDARRPYTPVFWAAFFFALATGVKLSGLGGAVGAFLFIGLALWKEKKRLPLKEMAFIAVIFATVIPFVFFMIHLPQIAKGMEMSSQRLLYRKTFKFHYTDKFTHPYLSQMWQWPTVHRPIWYLWEENKQTGTINGIVAMGNLLFWWSFIPVLLDMIYRAFKTKENKLLFILCGYLPLYLFWLSSLSNYGGQWHLKGGFFYYMLPCVPFMALALTDTLCDIQDTKIGRVSTWIFLAGLLVFLAAFYPILAGTPIQRPHFNRIMKLNIFKTWL